MGPPPGAIAPSEFVSRGSKVALALIEKENRGTNQCSARCRILRVACPRCRPGVRPCAAPPPVPYAVLGQNLVRCPRTTLEVGWWLCGFRRASSMALGQRARRCHAAPCVVCVLGLSQSVVLAAARQPPWPTQFGDFPRKDALDARLPSRNSQSANRSHDLSVARLMLSPAELTGDPCVCVCVRVCWGGGDSPFFPGLPVEPVWPHWRPRVGCP